MDPFVIGQLENTNEFDDEPSFGHVLFKNLSKAGDKILLISGITSQELSAKELLSGSIAVAKALKTFGVMPGEVVSIASENRFEFAFVLFGTLLYNCTFAPINLTYSEREMKHALGLSKPKIIFSSPFASEKVVNVVNKLKFVQKIVLMEDENPFGNHVILYKDFIDEKFLETVPFELKAADKGKAVSLIMCSSGTTGLAKGVQLSQNNLIAVTRFSKNTAVKLAVNENANDEEKIVLGLIPWFHAFGLTSLIGTIAATIARIVLLPKFEEGLFLSTIENYRCNLMFLVPPLMVFLAKSDMVDHYDLSCMRIIICGAAPLTKEVEQAVYDRLNNPNLTIRQGYGMSELSLSVLVQKSMTKPGSVGELAIGSFSKVIDENGRSLGPNQRGELCFKGNQLMLGYIGDEKATKDTIDKDGWLHTGDIGYYDEDKQFFIVDRIKELIKWKGFQVPPAEIEGLLLSHAMIRDAAVIGIPDDLAGEKALAFVVKGDPSLQEQSVIDYVAKYASPAKRLHGGVRFIDEIPKAASGKILRRELRDFLKNSKSKM